MVSEIAPFGESSVSEGSPKPVDLDEPAAKKPRTSDSIVSWRFLSESGNCPAVSSAKVSNPSTSSNSNTFSKMEPAENRKMPKDSLYFDGMQLFNSKRESKVTISPVRNKDFGISGKATITIVSEMHMLTFLLICCLGHSSNGSQGSSSSTASGSVTITKLSTGSTLNVESKDLKTILGSSGPGKGSKVDVGVNRISNSGNGFRLASKLDLVTSDAKQFNTNTKPIRVRSFSGSDGSIRCSKCWEIYSSKNGSAIHTCSPSHEQVNVNKNDHKVWVCKLLLLLRIRPRRASIVIKTAHLPRKILLIIRGQALEPSRQPRVHPPPSILCLQ